MIMNVPDLEIIKSENMPRRSHKKLRGRAKEEMLVTSRLMAISLLVDDYIYKNKPITLLEAKKFDKEITSLKLKCEKNTRSLQVVEKLKKYMKSIIKDQSVFGLQDQPSSFVTETGVDKNPSIALNSISENVENNITNSLTANTTTELFSTCKNQHSEINNITQESNPQKKITIDIISPVIRVTNIEIKSVESNDMITLKDSILKVNDKSEENIKYISKNIDLNKSDIFNNSTIEKEQARQDLVMLTSSNLRKSPELEKKGLIQEMKNPIEITTESKNDEKQTKINKKTCVKNKITAKNNIKTKTKKVINNTSKVLQRKSPKVNNSKNKPKDKTQMNYSWVENLKYVRDVSPDEHTELQIDDSFWSNLTLPGIYFD